VPAPRTEGGENRGSHVFDRFAEAAAEQGRTVARFETWESHEELRRKIDADFEAELEEGVEFLRARGWRSVAMVAKSFGGRLAPASARRVDQLVLWAPAVAFGEREERPSITVDALSDVEVPVRTLQGDEDDIVSVDNTATIAEHLPARELVELPGEDHSFKNDEERALEATLSFLR
jgi:alpha-beta hydrolase superfamily lysophospholipase